MSKKAAEYVRKMADECERDVPSYCDITRDNYIAALRQLAQVLEHERFDAHTVNLLDEAEVANARSQQN